jgi:osmotically-inducible protein OsmY
VVGVLGRSDLLRVSSRPDGEIRNEVADEVLGRMLLVDPRRVAIGVDRGVVTLTGELDIRADTEMAVRFVERLEGVVAVVDRLTYRYDERLADSNIAPLT